MMLSIGQAARILGVTPITARRWTEAGILPCVRTPGGHRRIAREDVMDLSRAIGGSNQAAVRRARERELEALVAASIAVAAQLDREALLPEIAKHVTVLCRCTYCAISSYASDDETLTILAEYDSGGRLEPIVDRVIDLREYPATAALLHDQASAVFNLDDPRTDPAERAELMRDRVKSNLVVPLVYQGRSIGLLEVTDAESSRTYSRQELRLVSALAGHAAVALHNAELFRAATSVDAAMRTLHGRMRTASEHILAASESGVPEDPLTLIPTMVRDAFDALSVMVTLDDAVVAAVAAPAEAGGVEPQRSEAHVLTSAADTSRGRLTVTVVMPEAAGDGESDLLEMTTAFAALISTYVNRSADGAASETTT